MLKARWLHCLVTLLCLCWVAGPAAAHDVLVGSNPNDGEHLPTRPDQLTLTFNNELLDLGQGSAAVVVTDANKQEILNQPLTIDGRDARVDLPALPDGFYSAAWSVVSSDGHRIQGLVTFSVGDATAPPANGNSAGSTADSTTNSPLPPSTTPADTATTAAASFFSHPAFWGVLITVLIGSIVTLFVYSRKRK